MSEVREATSVCTGCGARLQSENQDMPGYVPSSALGKEQVVCRRCFRIRNYGEFSRVVVPREEYEAQVATIAHHPGLVLYVLDVFDLEGSFVAGLANYVQKSQVVVVVNKVDLLPHEVRYEALDRWIRKSVQETGVQVTDVVFTSGQTTEGLDNLVESMEKYKHDLIYVVGMANVGKSTLLNRVMAKLMETTPFTASNVPGTTLGFVTARVKLPHRGSVSVVDTPGLIRGTRVTDALCTQCLKTTVPRSRLRPRVFQLNAGQSLLIGGFARIDFTEGPRQPLVCYVSNELVIHRTKVENAQRILQDHADDILLTPCAQCRPSFQDWVRYSVTTRQDTPSNNPKHALSFGASGADLVLPGLGWITLFGDDFQGELQVSKRTPVSVRRRLIGDLSRKKG